MSENEIKLDLLICSSKINSLCEAIDRLEMRFSQGCYFPSDVESLQEVTSIFSDFRHAQEKVYELENKLSKKIGLKPALWKT